MKITYVLLSELFVCFFSYGMKDMVTTNRYGVILAGGTGARLWPLSRIDHPKQFLSIDSRSSLLEQSLERVGLVVAPEKIWIIGSELHQKKLASLPVGSILIESVGRNTGPAILRACLALYANDPDATVIFVPADSYIPPRDYPFFSRCVQQALEFVEKHNVIALFGVKPTHAAAGYGYIEYDSNCCEMGLYAIKRFHEKPSERIASFYVEMPNMLWNIGIFAGKVVTFIDEFKRVAPDLYDEVIAWRDGYKNYEDITSISIDCAIMERSNRIAVLPVDFAWCDVGTIDTFVSIKKNQQKSNDLVVSIESHNNIVDVPDKAVALIGVDDICVIETPDALLITKRNKTEKVRSVVEHLKKLNQTTYV